MPRRLLTLCLLLPLAVHPGCRPDGYGMNCMSPTGPASRPTTMPKDDPAPDVDPTQYRSVIQFQVMRVELPAGTVNVSEQLWNYLNEESVTVNRSAKLGRNGIRMGVGEPGSWTDVARILEKLAGRPLGSDQASRFPGVVYDIVVRKDRPAQTVSTFFDDRSVATADYPPGDNVLAVAGAVDETNPQAVVLTGVPQIRSAGADPAARSDPRLGPVSLFRRSPFTDLTFRASLPAKGFVVLGPAKAALNASTVGHQFLLDQRDGLTFETVIVLIPNVLRLPVKPADAVP